MQRRLSSHICLDRKHWASQVAEKLERGMVGTEILNKIT